MRKVLKTAMRPFEIKPQEIQLAEQLVKSLAGPFEPNRFEDEYKKRLIQLIEAKGEGRTVHATRHKKMAPVIDLMQALQKSLAGAEKKPAAKAVAHHKAAAKSRKAS